MSANYYFTSDWHLNHDNILKYCDRPFKTVKEMNNKIISEYNRTVRPNDVVFFLGDMGFYSQAGFKELISALPGKKILILGNHDKWGMKTYYDAGFDAVFQEATIKLGKRMVHLNHIPRRTLLEFLRLIVIYWRDPHKRAKSFMHKWGRFMREWRKHRPATKDWTICGHVHNAWVTNGRNINVGVDAWKFRPVPLKSLISLMDKKEANL